MRSVIIMVAAMAMLLTAQGGVDACTAFVLDDGERHYFGSNYDWHIGVGYVLVNPRNVVKHGWPLPEDPGKPAQWQSRYGSVTFVQYGQGLPKGGMNEAGLVIEGLMLYGSEYPPPDQRPYIGSTSQFKQYLLDTCATVADVFEQMNRVRLAVSAWAPGIHFMVADAAGDCAVIAFKEGRFKAFRGADLPYKALANRDYDRSVAQLSASPTPGADFPTHTGGRFKIAVDRLAAFSASASRDAVRYAMDTLDRVSAGSRTQWRVVYDQVGRMAYWRCRPDEPLRWVDLGKIDFDCDVPATAISVQRVVSSEANPHLSRFTLEHNRNLVLDAFTRSRTSILAPESLWERVWRLPERQVCSK